MGEAARREKYLGYQPVNRVALVRPPRVGAVSFQDAMSLNTGCSMGRDEWIKGQARQAQLKEQTQRIADLLELNGISTRLPTELQMVGDVSGNIDQVDSYRAIRFLPLIAQRDRRPVKSALSFWLRTQKYVRYAVVTSGTRVPLNGDLKERMREHTANIRRWASEAGQQYGVRLIFRGTEFTVNDDGIHLHSNIVYQLDQVISSDRWSEFLAWSRDRLRAHWKDCGILEDAAEVVKYCMKPCDLDLLNEENLVWLFQQTYRAKMCQPLGKFAEWYKDLDHDKLKVAMVRRGKKSRLTLVQKAPREPASGNGGEIGENVIVGRTLPQSRWTEWAEPISLVMNFTRHPRTPEGIRRLAVLNGRSEQAATWWKANGAPTFIIYTDRPTVQTETMGDGTIIDQCTGEVLFEPDPNRAAHQREETDRGFEDRNRVNKEIEVKIIKWNAGAKDRATWKSIIEKEIGLRSVKQQH